MNQLTEEQRERLDRIRKRSGTVWVGLAREDIDFLLSLLDSQAAARRAEETAAEIVREWSEHDMDESYGSQHLEAEFGAGHLEERIALALTATATAMRDACVEKVKAALTDQQRSWTGGIARIDYELGVRAAYTHVLAILESLTLDQVQEKR